MHIAQPILSTNLVQRCLTEFNSTLFQHSCHVDGWVRFSQPRMCFTYTAPHHTLSTSHSSLKIHAAPCGFSAHFIVIVGVQVLQSIEILALVHSLSKTPEFGAVSLQSPTGSP